MKTGSGKYFATVATCNVSDNGQWQCNCHQNSFLQIISMTKSSMLICCSRLLKFVTTFVLSYLGVYAL